MLISVPKSASITEHGIEKVQYFGIAFHVHDGLIDVPRWLVPDLLERGCHRADGGDDTIGDERAELEAVTDAAPHEIHIYLDAHGAPARYHEKNIHPLSDAERAKGNEAVADELDRLHHVYYEQVVKLPGQLFIPGFEQQKAHALAIHDALKSGSKKPPMPWSDEERLKARVEKARAQIK